MRKIFSLPNTAHRWLLGPLMGQYHIKYQLYMKDIKLLYNVNNNNNNNNIYLIIIIIIIIIFI